jgi:hypothetical protein
MSDSRWLINRPAQFLRANVHDYDHLLTWDYETFGTSIKVTAEDFATALQQRCGFDANDNIRVDLFAHSMVCLVSRYMVELAGGHDLVDRLVIAGPPNYGTTLANSIRGMLFVVTSMLNRASLIPPVGATKWVLKQIHQQGRGPEDLQKDSDFVRDLNTRATPSSVPYLVLAGENLADPNERNRINRLAHKILDTSLDLLFGEQHDTVIGLNSMITVRGRTDLHQTVTLPCDHFHYYVIPHGQDAVKGWVPG